MLDPQALNLCNFLNFVLDFLFFFFSFLGISSLCKVAFPFICPKLFSFEPHRVCAVLLISVCFVPIPCHITDFDPICSETSVFQVKSLPSGSLQQREPRVLGKDLFPLGS